MHCIILIPKGNEATGRSATYHGKRVLHFIRIPEVLVKKGCSRNRGKKTLKHKDDKETRVS